MSPRRLTRAESRALTVQRLLDSAENIFRKKGYGAASVDEIAEDAGYSKGAVYANFENKEALFMAVQDRQRDDMLVGMVTAVTAGGTDEELVHRIQEWQRDYMATAHDRFLIDGDYWLVAARDPQLSERVADSFRVGVTAAAQVIEEETTRRGLKPPLDPLRTAKVLFAVTYGVQTQARYDVELNEPEVFGSALAMLLGLDPKLVDGVPTPPSNAERV